MGSKWPPLDDKESRAQVVKYATVPLGLNFYRDPDRAIDTLFAQCDVRWIEVKDVPDGGSGGSGVSGRVTLVGEYRLKDDAGKGRGSR